MKASELRIGNYLEVSLASRNGRKRFNKIGLGDIVRIYEGNFKSFIYEPIPLTEEWLLRFGFKIKGSCASLGEFDLFLERGFYKNGRIYFKSWGIIDKIPDYVHQLQNLYFALTGEELTISDAKV